MPASRCVLGELARKLNVVALAYHVDYWDELGWKDRFAMPEAMQRQLGYVRRLSHPGAFTPQIVRRRRHEFGRIGSHCHESRSCREARCIGGRAFQGQAPICRSTLPERWREPLDVYVISYLAEATTPVARGENAQRSLKEFNIVRSIPAAGQMGRNASAR